MKKSNVFKHFASTILAYLCVPVYYVSRWFYLHIAEVKGLYLFIHKSYGRDLQKELNIAWGKREVRKAKGEIASIYEESLEWEGIK